ncbi:MAG: S8 family serine peptidase [Aquabacterium sp.]
MSFAHRALASFIGPALSLGVGLNLLWAADCALAAGAASSPSLAPSRPALGVIVQLKEQSHELPQSTEAGRSQRAQRLARLASAAGYPSSLPWEASVGNVAHTRVPTRLTRDQVQKVIGKLMATGEVAWAEPDVMQSLQQAAPMAVTGPTPNDPYVPNQWWVDNVDLSPNPPSGGVPNWKRAWANVHRGADSNQVVVAVLDTGIVASAQEFGGGRILAGYDFVSETVYDRDDPGYGGLGRDANPADPGDWLTSLEKSGNTLFQECAVQDSTWHGTEVASIIGAAANNSVGMAGAHWNARIQPVRVSGKCGAALSDIYDAMMWAGGVSQQPVANATPAKVINISFGGDGDCGQVYQSAINSLRAAGVLVVASAGNSQGVVTRPANCAGVVSVAALNRIGIKANYSGFGAGVTVSTVGGDISGGAWDATLKDTGVLVLANNGTQGPGQEIYRYGQGTSFAAPQVSALAAMMWELNPGLSVDDVINGLKRSARPHVTSQYVGQCSNDNPGRCACTTATCGAGILDAERALQYALNPSTDFALNNPLPTVNIDSLAVQNAAMQGPDDGPVTPTPTPTTSGRNSGGGGAVDAVELLGLCLGGVLSLFWRAARHARLRAGRP